MKNKRILVFSLLVSVIVLTGIFLLICWDFQKIETFENRERGFRSIYLFRTYALPEVENAFSQNDLQKVERIFYTFFGRKVSVVIRDLNTHQIRYLHNIKPEEISAYLGNLYSNRFLPSYISVNGKEYEIIYLLKPPVSYWSTLKKQLKIVGNRLRGKQAYSRRTHTLFLITIISLLSTIALLFLLLRYILLYSKYKHTVRKLEKIAEEISNLKKEKEKDEKEIKKKINEGEKRLNGLAKIGEEFGGEDWKKIEKEFPRKIPFWSKMEEKSRNDLIAGEYIFEILKKNKNIDDFSVVGLSFSKSLERELRHKIFFQFHKLIKRKYKRIDDVFKNDLQDRAAGIFVKKIKNSRSNEPPPLELGTMAIILGFSCGASFTFKEIRTDKEKIDNSLIYKEFRNYLKERGIKINSEFCQEIYNVAEKYRNPSAHDQILLKDAVECREKVIELLTEFFQNVLPSYSYELISNA